MIQTSHLTELVAGGIPDEYRGTVTAVYACFVWLVRLAVSALFAHATVVSSDRNVMAAIPGVNLLLQL